METSPYPRRMGTEDPIRKGFGMRLKAARERQGLTQQFVADLFEVTKGTVSAWETGGGDPGVFRLRALAKLYQQSADALLWDDSLSMDSMRVAAMYDNLSDEKRKKFDLMVMSHFADALTDGEVEDKWKETPAGRELARNRATPAPASKSAPSQGDRLAGGTSAFGDLNDTKQKTRKKG